jgi:hypothetical protein
MITGSSTGFARKNSAGSSNARYKNTDQANLTNVKEKRG